MLISRWPLTFALLALFTAIASPARANLWIGQQAPELSIDTLVQGPDDAEISLDAFEGEVLVIDFFSTTCPKCRRTVPHLNQLARTFQGEPVTFLVVSREPVERVRSFLDETPINAWVGLDEDWSMQRDYRVRGVPMSVIINPKGAIAAVTHPKHITEQTIETTLAGETPETPLSASMLQGDEQKSPRPLLNISVQSAKPDTQRSVMQGNGLRAKGLTMREALGRAMNINPWRIVSDSLLLDAKYNFTIEPPGEQPELVTPLLNGVLRMMIHPQVERTTREMEVYLLERTDSESPGLKRAAGGDPAFNGAQGDIEGANVSLDQIATNLQSELNRPVLNLTDLSGGYNFELSWEYGDVDSLKKAVREQLGLKLRPATRNIQVLKIERGEPDASQPANQNAPARQR